MEGPAVSVVLGAIKTGTVFVPCAGIGSRARKSDSELPKALLDVGGLPAVLSILSMYPLKWKFVVALGYEGNLIRQVLDFAKRDFLKGAHIEYVETDSYRSKDRGLSHTLLDAEGALKGEPFVFHAVDSIFPQQSAWTGWLAERNQVLTSVPLVAGSYRVPTPGGKRLMWQKHDFTADDDLFAYVGVAHVWDYGIFWEHLHDLADADPEGGETLGIVERQTERVELPRGSWHDIGSRAGQARLRMSTQHGANVLPKSNEAIWFLDSEVVKFHRDEAFIQSRIRRAFELRPYVPMITSWGSNFYVYKKVQGEVLSAALRIPEYDVRDFYSFLWRFWQPSVGNGFETAQAADPLYLSFYRDKTFERVQQLEERFPGIGSANPVEGVHVPPLSELLNQIRWWDLARITPARVHGDLHAENVLVRGAGDYILLDWRQDMAGSTGAIGDLYYDLGKLAHGFRVDHGSVLDGAHQAYWGAEDGWTFRGDWRPEKRTAYDQLSVAVQARGLSWNRVQLMEGLVYVNIACLHSPDEYARYLGLLGRLMLYRAMYYRSNSLGGHS